MDDEKRISKLADKFISNQISSEELMLLYQHLNHDENSSKTEEFSLEKWNRTVATNTIIPSKLLWGRIKGRLAENASMKIGHKSYFRHTLLSFTKYAAALIFVLFGVWLIYSQYSNKTEIVKKGYTEYTVPYGSKSSLILPDGTKIWLNSGSKINYTGDLLNKDERIVFLDGEAFFEVEHSDRIPFIVRTSDLNIRVFGTRFNVKSFQEEKNIETTLISGSIVIEKTDHRGNIIQNVRLKPNQIVSYSKENEKFLIRTSENNPEKKPEAGRNVPELIISAEPKIKQTIDMAISWKDNKLTFKRDSIYGLITKLQRWYDVEITLKNKDLKNSTFTGTFDNETIEQALDALKLTTRFSYSIDKNRIVIF